MRKRTLNIVVLIAALVFFGGLVAYAQDAMTPLDIPLISDMEALQPGQSAPPFKLKNTDGEIYEYTGKSGETTLMVFWSIFCEPCRAEMPLIQSLYEHYKPKGFNVISVALDGDLAENIRQFAKKGKYTFHVLLDEEDDEGSLVVAEDYVVPGTPTIYIVNKEGKITFSKVGRVDEADLEKAIENALGM